MVLNKLTVQRRVNCRVGSLERSLVEYLQAKGVNCRVGSLEKVTATDAQVQTINCRVGSLEIAHTFQSSF